MHDLPGWLLKRAREITATRAHTLLGPTHAGDRAIYLLETANGACELHCVENADDGIEGVSYILTRAAAAALLGEFAGALAGRREGIEVRPLPPLPVGADAKP